MKRTRTSRSSDRLPGQQYDEESGLHHTPPPS